MRGRDSVISNSGFHRSVRRPIILPAAESGRLPSLIKSFAEHSSCAESVGLANLGHTEFLISPDYKSSMLVARDRNVLTALANPLGDPESNGVMIREFRRASMALGLWPAVYKATGQFVEDLRAEGFRPIKVGEEAVVDLQGYTKAGKPYASLRRKINKADKSGIECRYYEAGTLCALKPALAEIDQKWRAKNGLSLGFSQGRYSADYCDYNDFFIAFDQESGDPVAYISVWKDGAGFEQMLDLMRQDYERAPDGIMYYLIDKAMERAKEHGYKEFSLCNAMFKGVEDQGRIAIDRIFKLAKTRLKSVKSMQSLEQFKDSFNPDWRGVYIAARNPLPFRAVASFHRLVRNQEHKHRLLPESLSLDHI